MKLIKTHSLEAALDLIQMWRTYSPGYWKRNWSGKTIVIEVVK